jgi:CheY-like chemotaxis protein
MGIKLLVIDDEADLVKTISQYLELEGITSITAGNGIEALAKIEVDRPDFILCDVHMPVMNGYQFMEELNRRNFGTIPVLFMSGHTGNQLLNLQKHKNFIDQLSKPVDVDTLVILIKKLINFESKSAS